MTSLPDALRILVVDDEPEIRKSLTAILATVGYSAAAAATESEAMEQIRAFSPHLILLDINLAGGENGIEICRKIKADAANAAIHVMILTGASTRESIEAAIHAGAVDYIIKPFKARVLIEKFIKLTARPPAAPIPEMGGADPSPAEPATPSTGAFRILVVDDEPEIQKSVSAVLRQAGYQADTAADALHTFKKLREYSPHLILLDINLGRSIDGIEICRRIKEEKANADIKIVMMTGAAEKTHVKVSIESGAVDYFVKPIRAAVLLRKVALHLLGQSAADRIGPETIEPPDDMAQEDEVDLDAADSESTPKKRRRGSGLASGFSIPDDDVADEPPGGST